MNTHTIHRTGKHQKCRNDVQNMTIRADITFWINKRSFTSTWQKGSSSRLLSWLVLSTCNFSVFSLVLILCRPTTAVRWNRWSVDRWSRQGAGRLSSHGWNARLILIKSRWVVVFIPRSEDLLLQHSGQECRLVCLCPTSHKKEKLFLCWLVADILFDGPNVVGL